MIDIKNQTVNDIFNIEKGSLQSSKNIEGYYHFITASAEWKTHETYTHDCEALIFAMGASGSLGRTHYINDKFISSDLCFILTPKPLYVGKIDMKFYFFYFNTFREDIVKKTATGTSKLAINLRNFSKLEIPYFDLEYQQIYVEKISKIEHYQKQLKIVLNDNINDVNLLKKQIIRDAIQGKLVKKNKNDESASKLLETVKQEKERWIEEKKIRKEKNLPQIADEEKPFKIPREWEWVRLGDLCYVITDGDHQPPPQTTEGVNFLVISNVSKGYLNFENTRFVSREYYDGLPILRKPDKGDILFTVTGSYGIPIIIDTDREFCFQRHIALLKPNVNIITEYLYWVLTSDLVKKQCDENATGTAQKTVSLTTLRNLKVPLPPLNEQKRISEKVGQLMALCNELEENIEQSKLENEHLLKVVLQKAFTVKEEVLN